MHTIPSDLSLIRQKLLRDVCGCEYLTTAYPCGRCQRLEALDRIEGRIGDLGTDAEVQRFAFAELNRENQAMRGLLGRLRESSTYAMTKDEWDAAVDRVLGDG